MIAQRVVFAVGSPRENGNSAALAEEVAEEVRWEQVTRPGDKEVSR